MTTHTDKLTHRCDDSLSGGEAQRIRLATQISSQLVNVLYILDEPSIGLHQRDNHRLIDSLKQLRDLNNTVIVVEHDRDMMEAADYIVDIGPFAGEHGGHVMAAGSYDEILKADSLTADYLNGKKSIQMPAKRRKGNGEKLTIVGATGNNLKNVTVDFPLSTLICVTGVSGSGKSSLITDTLYPILNQRFYRSDKKPLAYKEVLGLEHIDKVIEINQQPIGRTPRSNPATYVGVFDDIRQLYANLQESKIRGYKSGRFSFNVSGGRCEECKGAGMKVIEMNFLPDIYVKCDACNGQRYNAETNNLLDNKFLLKDYKLWINTTPVGMYPHTEESLPLDFSVIGSEHYLFDLIYNPEETVFLRQGRLHGARTKNGLAMLHEQAELSWEF